MDRTFQELERHYRWTRKKFSIEFTNPPHLMDCLVYARKLGMETQFISAIYRVAMMFVSDSAGSPPSTAYPPEPSPAKPGETVAVTFSPDSPNRPSFTWIAYAHLDKPGAKPLMLMHGGLIYRDNAEWSIHT